LETHRSTPEIMPGRLAVSVAEVMALTGICRDKVYQLIRSGQLPARKLGKRTLITAEDLQAFLRALPTNGQK
jgi:excisionase family DNA binding protein